MVFLPSMIWVQGQGQQSVLVFCPHLVTPIHLFPPPDLDMAVHDGFYHSTTSVSACECFIFVLKSLRKGHLGRRCLVICGIVVRSFLPINNSEEDRLHQGLGEAL